MHVGCCAGAHRASDASVVFAGETGGAGVGAEECGVCRGGRHWRQLVGSGRHECGWCCALASRGHEQRLMPCRLSRDGTGACHCVPRKRVCRGAAFRPPDACDAGARHGRPPEEARPLLACPDRPHAHGCVAVVGDARGSRHGRMGGGRQSQMGASCRWGGSADGGEGERRHRNRCPDGHRGRLREGRSVHALEPGLCRRRVLEGTATTTIRRTMPSAGASRR